MSIDIEQCDRGTKHDIMSNIQRWIENGSPKMPIWIVGEAPGAEEVATGRPFTGTSGHLLDQMLLETGFTRSNCFVTNVCHERPPPKRVNGRLVQDDIGQFFLTKTNARQQGISPLLGRYPLEPVVRGRDHLIGHLLQHNPQFIIPVGNTALWALSGLLGIGKWRGSILTASETPKPSIKMVPTFHPAAVLREWGLRNITVQDLRRAKRESLFPEIRYPQWNFILRPTLEQVAEFICGVHRRLSDGPVTVTCDIETRGGHIACIGLGTSKTDAICIPLMCVERNEGYWTEHEEHLLVMLLRDLLTQPTLNVVFQNGAYDLQYFAKEYGFLPHISDDTMLMQHVCFPGMRKGLDFLSSLYCQYHRYWKDDGKNWDSSMPEEIHWRYNAEDCVRTFECWEVLCTIIRSFGLTEQYDFQMRQLFPIVLRMMLKGIRFNEQRRAQIRLELEAFVDAGNKWLTTVLGHPLNVESNKQMKELIYDDLCIPTIFNRKTGSPTLDDEALDRIQRKNPLLRPLLEMVRDIRSANTALSNVLVARVSEDSRARCTYNMAGTETFRFSSAEDAFGDGFNMQNLTKGDED